MRSRFDSEVSASAAAVARAMNRVSSITRRGAALARALGAVGLALSAWAGSVAALPPSTTTLSPLSVSATTGEKPQSKVWTHAGRWWCVLPNSSGTWLWRLDGASWTSILKLSDATTTKADVKVVGDVAHVLLFEGVTSELASVEYVSATQQYVPWSVRPGNVAITLDAGVETGTIDIDSQGRMWLASDEQTLIMARYSDSPYAVWQGPITLASGVSTDDISVVTSFPSGMVGVMWSNQTSKRFGFRTHAAGAAPDAWSADEVPASQSALDGIGLGMADDHLHVAVASDGTLYAAVKTSYDTPGYPKIALLVRRPGGTWDNLYPVDDAGTRGIVLLDEPRGVITVVYTSVEGAGDILYKESPISPIAFGARSTLIAGSLNDATSMKENLRGDVVILASNGATAQGLRLEDPGPVGWWRMEEGGGTALIDASAYGNHAALPGGAAWAPGVEGLSLVLNGSGQYGSVPDQASLHISDAITLATWVRPQRVATQHLVKKAVNAATDGYELSLSTSTAGAKPFVRFNEKTNGNLYRVDGTQPYVADGTTWTHLAATYDGSTIRLYVNGVLDSSKTASLKIATNTLPLTLGTQSDGAAGFSLQGGMDEARVYPRALTAVEIQHLMDHTITASAGPGGAISPPGAVVVGHNAAQTFTITPNGGFHVSDVLVDGGSVGAVTTYTFPAVTRSHTIAATFSSGTQHTITASAGPGGSITPSGAIVVAGGANQSFSMIPIQGYHVADVLVDGASVGAVAIYTFTGVSASHTIVASFAPDAAAAGLVGWWPLDEGTGTIAHDLAQGLDATLSNGPAWITGVEGGALSFDGANDYAQVPADPRLDLTSAITIAAWIRPARVATQDVVKKAVNGGTDGYELALSSAGKVFLRFNQKTSADTYRLNSVASYPIDGTWMHVAATYDGATMKMYVNGVLDGSVAKTVTIATNGNALGIGAQSDAVRWFQGALDDVRLYNRALSAGEIQALLSHTITASAGPGGSVTPAGAVVVARGASQSFTIAPSPGYQIADVLVDAASVGAVTGYTFPNVIANHTLLATFVNPPPAISAVTATPGGDGRSATVRWTTDEASDSRVDYGTAPGTLGSSASEGTPVTSHVVTLTGLSSGTLYYFRVRSADAQGAAATEPPEAQAPLSFSTPSSDEIAASPAGGTVISTAHPCVTVPVTFTRTDATPVRAFSVTVVLGADLALCGAGIEEGPYLSSLGGPGSTSFEVIDHHDGSYTVDGAILGLPCGVTGSGTLFSLHLASPAPGGSGTVSIGSVKVRDCDNNTVAAAAGPAAAIAIDNLPPAAVADLGAGQAKSGNGSGGITSITLNFTPPGDAAGFEVYRAPYGNYPEYDDPPGAGAEPSAPPYPPGTPWVKTAVTASGQSDAPPARDVWYYVVFSRDAAGNVSAVSNRTGGTLDYHLGDVSDGVTPGQGDNQVGTADLSLLGAHYGITLAASDPYGYLDVGPTLDYSPNARPTTDGRIDFEDLVMFGMNYGMVAAPQAAMRPAASGENALALGALPEAGVGETVSVPLLMRGAGDVRALSVELGYDASVVEPVAVGPGALLALQPLGALVLSAQPGDVDLTLLGRGAGIAGEGEVARVTFRVKSAGAAALTIRAAGARDGANHAVAVRLDADLGMAPPQAPARTALGLVAPNPFSGSASVALMLARPGPVRLEVYDLGGRRVRTLVDGMGEAGIRHVTWDGRGESGTRVPAGVYLMRFEAGDVRQVRRVQVIR